MFKLASAARCSKLERKLRKALPAAANAALNDAPLETLEVAWAAPEAIVERAPWQYVIAADVLYEPRNVEQLLALLPQLVDKGGRATTAAPRPSRR